MFDPFWRQKIKHSDSSDNLFALFHNNQNKNKNGKKQYELENYLDSHDN